jgi:Raf kinase inhibitor-like YbhB/YbcL family protein
MKSPLVLDACLLALLVALVGCQGKQPTEAAPVGQNLQVESSAFADGATIPVRYTCDGQDVSPPLSWTEPPAGTRSLALIFDDPDAPVGTWVHWVLFDLPAATRSLAEGIPADEAVAGGVHGSNSWKRLGYGGPCPPKGSTHRYVFKLYALNTSLALVAGATKGNIEEAMSGHILAQGQLTGQYGR